MNCDQASTHLVDVMTGNLPEGVEKALRLHLDACAACREQELELRTLWAELARLPAPMPRTDAVGRFAQTLARGVPGGEAPEAPPAAASRPTQGAATRTRRLVIPAALAASLLIGVAAGRNLAPRDDQTVASASGTGSQFLLLLHERPSTRVIPPDELRRVVAEYAAWARDLQQDGRLVAAEKLADDPGRWIRPRADGIEVGAVQTSTAGVIGGYFVIAADSYEDAIRIARECPHLRYGGEIEVRAIEPV